MQPIFTFSKRIKDNGGILAQEVRDPQDIAKIDQVLHKLDNLPRVSTSSLQEIGLKTNPKKWVVSLLKSYPPIAAPAEMENLLLDFIDTMKTRMREESKYAIALLMENKLILCHSVFGEQTITPEWKIIPRMLDTDNILRYVCFVQDNGIWVKFWEKEATSSFIEWLGLPRKQAFLFGGAYRILCEIDGVTVEFQLTEQEIEQWMKRHPELKAGKIKFTSSIQLVNINEVRVGRKRYQNTEDFLQDYEAEKFGAPLYQKEYERIKKNNLPLLMKYYDEKTQVVRKEGDDETTEVSKSTAGFDILFVDEDIELRASYLADIATRFINGEPVQIFHAALKFRTPPYELGSLQIHNQLAMSPIIERLTTYYGKVNLQDKMLDTILRYVILVILSRSNSKSPIARFLDPLCQKIIEDNVLRVQLSKLEDSAIEYKSGDYFSGRTENIVQKLAEDMRKKLQDSACKIYIIGVEDNGRTSLIAASRLKNDRVESVRTGLMNELSADVFSIPMIQDDEGILVVAVVKR